ncbi:hypothetical protein KKG29_00840 [Patescibacteria group bacterium]|nr:hypothetical protein [Patescibacteria group bacterium]MBU3999711.1 hypothetical protein [Patescibacteria group bacterium]MBU4056630.1 hypothetical protein [Patescibacteria group bacterium]MBU4368357.1 hypothetical protein [Patescibacteria group bacterium]
MNKINFLSAIFLILVGVIGRFLLINYVGIPNFEIITALTLVSAVFLGGVWTFVVPLSIIAITDVFIGNSPVLIFTWSAFAIIGIFGWLSRRVILRERSDRRISHKCAKSRIREGFLAILGMTTLGIGSSVFFFFYTNFGWWLVSGMYPHTPYGLIQCYIMGLPFFKNNLIGNLIFVPMFSGTAIFLKLDFKNKIWNQEKIKIFQKS